MGIRFHNAAFCALAALGIGGSTAVVSADETVRVVTAPSLRAKTAARQHSRAYLSDSLGGIEATSQVEMPDPALAPLALELAPRDSASRRYGELRLSVYRTIDESTAFALLRSVRPVDAVHASLGDGGWANGNAIGFWAGPYVAIVEGTAEPRIGLAEALGAKIGKVSAPAPLVAHLPENGQLKNSVMYLPSFETLQARRPEMASDVFLMERGGAHAVVADYEQSGGAPYRVTIVEYETPQLASDGERSLLAYYAGLPEEARRGRVTRRDGNYLVEAINVVDEGSALALVGSIDYAFKEVKWLKEPLPPRLNRLTASGEARKVAQLLVSSFGIVGVGLGAALVFGGLFGAGVFRLRRRAARNAFSDAGGMVCLDLDPALPPTSTAGLLRAADRDESY